MIQAGEKYSTKECIVHRNCGVPPDRNIWVTHVEQDYISFWMWCPQRGDIKARVRRSQFGQLFDPDPYAPVNREYAKTEPFDPVYPDEFLHR